MDAGSIKRLAVRAAYRAGDILRGHQGRPAAISKKGAIDLVTAADVASEKCIIETIRETFPGHAIIAEESGRHEGSDRTSWIIDPLDGTTNFAHGLPIYAVSIACVHDDEIIAGAVFNPITGELFTAVKDQGAELNGHPISVSVTSSVEDSLLVTGFPYDVHSRADALTERFARCLKAAQGIRRLGSAALDLCFVACGRFDGFWEEGLKPWDTAAGTLIAREAGASVTDFADQPFQIDMKQITATNGHIHSKLTAILRTEDL